MRTTSVAGTPLTLVTKPDCAPETLCAKCSLVMVIRNRFHVFQAKFGRQPRANEPLFFDPSNSRPVKASRSQAREQVQAAAQAMGVKAAPVLRLLKLDSATEKTDLVRESPGQTLPGRLRPKARGERRMPERTASEWQRFAGDKRLHRLHNVTREELKTLSGLAMMGEVRNSSDFLYILNLIREASEPVAPNTTDKAL